MFQRFTPEARRAVNGSHRIAGHLRRGQVGTEHLLLGLIGEWDDVAEAVRHDLDIDLQALRASLEDLMDDGEIVQRGHRLSYAPDAKRALMFAQDEAWRLDDPSLGTEHLLLGLLRDREGLAGAALRNLGAELDDMRRRVVNVKRRELPGGDR